LSVVMGDSRYIRRVAGILRESDEDLHPIKCPVRGEKIFALRCRTA
jgi:hypothetical protein